MSRPALEVADVIRRHGREFLKRYGVSSAQRCVLKSLVACRTATLGGHLEQCDRCAHRRAAYNSCRNRHCPKCQGAERARWLEQRRNELLPVEYFHVVFTLPEPIARMALQNKKVLYDLLFASASETLQQIAADPKQLGGRIGFLSVLHTWGQTLQHHPHLHCVIPGGAVSPDQTQWIGCPRGFFLPVKVLSRMFRGKFLHGIKRAYRAGRLSFHGRLSHLAQREAFERELQPLYERDWVVYAKRPFGSAEQVLKYLARYTHRVAISNHRLEAIEDGQVTFRYKDYRKPRDRQRTMTLDGGEFLRRFLQHVLPKGFVRIRHYGFLANRHRTQMLALCRSLLQADVLQPEVEPDSEPVEECELCPHCGVGRMLAVQAMPRPRISELLATPWPWDTS